MSETLFPSTPKTYHAISRLLHWLMAFLIISLVGLGWGSEFIHSDLRSTIMTVHKSLGILALILFCARLLARIILSPPPLNKEFPKIIKLIAESTHAILYILMLIMPLSGWMLVSATGRMPLFMGLIQLPALMPKSPDLVPFLKETHEISAIFLTGLVLLHISAALYHHFICKDQLLFRMLPKR